MVIKVKLSRQENIDYFDGATEVELDMEEYLKGVVPAEIGNPPIEASKAQAVAARTYAYSRMKANGYISDKSSDAQAFRAPFITNTSYARAHEAVDATAGELIYYDDGYIGSASYSASNGGRTYSSKEVWGTDRPYLQAQYDPWDSSAKKNGHGVGMSQVGAKNAATIGKPYNEILALYYQGTYIKKVEDPDEKPVPAPSKPEEELKPLTAEHFVWFLHQMVGQPYWYGTCCYKCKNSLLTSKRRQYPDQYPSKYDPIFKANIQEKAVSADCIGLGKGYCWTGGGKTVLEAIGTDNEIKSTYGANCPDHSATGMYEYAKRKNLKNGTIDTLPEVPGLCLYRKGHVAFYIGNGELIEAQWVDTGICKGVTKGRTFTHWFQFPGIDYSGTALFDDDPPKPAPAPAPSDDVSQYPTLRRGDEGEYVVILQTELVSREYTLGNYGANGDGIDGKFGKSTENAVRAFQKSEGIKVDGIVGKDTWGRLMAV